MHIIHDADPSRLPHATPAGVRFTYLGQARTVSLAGTFNSWVGDEFMMVREAGDLWSVTLPLSAGRHLYKLVIDGTEWIPDPANPWIAEDGQNNSALLVDEAGAVFIRKRATGPEQPGPLYARAALASPAWLRDAVVYQLSVRAFAGTFDGVRARLGHLADLGVNTIWMMPVHPIGHLKRRGTLGDPYAVRDFDAIDPDLGDACALRDLIAAIHARGMRVVFDWTLNRSSADHPFTASHPHWYQRDGEGKVCYRVPNRDYFAGFDFADRDLRATLIESMRAWVRDFNLDGMRFDDSDITPTDFLDEIRAALAAIKPDIALISQAYDEYHHLAACDLTYEGGTREVLRRIAHGEAGAHALAEYWAQSTYSFPRGALRLRWLEEKEQPRAAQWFGGEAHLAAAAVQLALDGVPHLMMGQEFGDASWRDWTVLFEPYQLDWDAFDADVFQHYSALIRLRRQHPALRHGSVEFLTGLGDAVVGLRRRLDGSTVTLFANLGAASASVPRVAGALLYQRGWDQAGQLAAHGCVMFAEDILGTRS